MGIDTQNTNVIDYTEDIIDIVNAITSVKNSIDENTSMLSEVKTSIDELKEEVKLQLDKMNMTQDEYLERASTENLGIYTKGSIGALSRALLMISISENQLEELKQEMENPTSLPNA